MITSRLAALARPGLGALAMALLAGCSVLPASLPFFGSTVEKPKPAELQANPGLLGVRQAWVARIGEVSYALGPAVNGTTLTLASGAGSLVALDSASGRELWRANAGAPLAAGVGSDGTTAAVITRANDVVAFADGKETWRQRMPALAYTPPFVAGGRVFVLAADRSVTAFDGRNGHKLWTQSRPGEPLVLSQSGVILAVGDTLVVGQGGRLAGLNPANGSIRWEAPIATARGINDVERLTDLVGRVSRVGTNICARAFQTAVGCVDAARGTVAWTQRANGFEGVHGDEANVFGTEADGKVVAWKRDTGQRAWTNERLLHRGLTAPLALGRSVVVGDSMGFVHFLSREDGSLLNRLSTDGSPIVAAPLVAGNTLVVVTRNGTVYGFVPE
ncbi:outer membrane protein assembly factor BamB [Caenimonas sedimenti]|uniref:Outer membrane protein assembly factor BamB n=1 Tax=Caenimonas sedimenti TaxID=2596921 RepID=A0A562ZGZ1_9BURK|nr:outer membrane protein assembly factor BamB [Caenimonas sedimenti]TWO66974.1 outer membrane protein assembly factor BamB [Caenimonas sedimenti]